MTIEEKAKQWNLDNLWGNTLADAYIAGAKENDLSWKKITENTVRDSLFINCFKALFLDKYGNISTISDISTTHYILLSDLLKLPKE